MIELTSDEHRASDALKIKIGTVVHDAQGEEWMFVGWSLNTIGQAAHFIKSMQGRQFLGDSSLWHYTASFLHTLLRKFPDLQRCVKKELA